MSEPTTKAEAEAPTSAYPETLTPQGTRPRNVERPADFVSLATPQGMPGVTNLSGKTERIDFMGFDPLFSGTEAWNTPNVYTFAGRHWQDGDEAPVEYIPHLRDAVDRVHPHLNPWGRKEPTQEPQESGPRTSADNLPQPSAQETLNRLVGGEDNRAAITQSVTEYSGLTTGGPAGTGIPSAYPPGHGEPDETDDETDTPPSSPSSGGRTRTRNRSGGTSPNG